MSTYLPSTQQDSISHIGFGCSLPSPSALRTPPKDVQLEEGSVLSQSTHSHGQPESSPLEVDHSPTTDLSTLADLASRLRPFLPTNYRWLGQGGLKVAGTRPIDAGGFADIWVGEMEDRKVAVKSYRCYASADYMPTYKRFYHEVLAYARVSDHYVVPFIGVYSTREHPFALVFEFMEHLNLGEYLRNNRDVGKLELLLEVAHAVKDIHGRSIVHGNLKITNILVDAGGHIRIAGLGAASIPSVVSEVEVDWSFHGAAPELIDPQRFGLVGAEITKASDIYAFGVIAWQVFAGRVLFSHQNEAAGMYSMLKGRRPGRPEDPELSDRLWKLIKGCWKGGSAQRKTISVVVAVLEAELHRAR